MQGHVAIDAPWETTDAQLFAQSAHAPDQTGQRSRLLHCLADLAVPSSLFCHPPCFSWNFTGRRPFTTGHKQRWPAPPAL